jgi:ABC-type proline/glycine betaine transport system ATPase subunit
VLEDGSITQEGTWESLVERPGSPFVEALVDARR